jgi:hypothetical protein
MGHASPGINRDGAGAFLRHDEFSRRGIQRAVDLAAKKNPGYLERTYRTSKYYVGYYMK